MTIRFWLVIMLSMAMIIATLSFVYAQTGQEMLERQIGSYVISNAQCSGQLNILSQELVRLKAELEALKKTNTPEPAK